MKGACTSTRQWWRVSLKFDHKLIDRGQNCETSHGCVFVSRTRLQNERIDLLELVWAMLHPKPPPNAIWDEALPTVVHVQSRLTYSSLLKEKYPYLMRMKMFEKWVISVFLDVKDSARFQSRPHKNLANKLEKQFFLKCRSRQKISIKVRTDEKDSCITNVGFKEQ